MADPVLAESTPTIPSSPTSLSRPARPSRTVTFDPHPTVSTINRSHPPARRSGAQSHSRYSSNPSSSALLTGTTPPVLSGLNDKLRWKNQGPQIPSPTTSSSISKIGPQRTTKTAQKLKILPNPDVGDDGPEEESGRDVYSQFTRIKDPTARRDAARLGKADRDRLPRVTAYCTASAYRLDGLTKFLNGRGRARGAVPRRYDECLYTPYEPPREMDKSAGTQPLPSSTHEQRYSDHEVGRGHSHRSHRHHQDMLEWDDDDNNNNKIDDESQDLISAHQIDTPSAGLENTTTEDLIELDHSENSALDTVVHIPEVFLFEYGTIVIWGMTVAQEHALLKEVSRFEQEKLASEDVQTENFNFYYTNEYQARIYNDFISLRHKKNHMVKLAISHALAQSVKTSLFEDLVDNTIELTKHIPERIALTGNVNLSRRQILMQVGELFILRINIHLQGSVLDSPELMWAEPQLDPIYQAVRSYLEMDQRVRLLTERLDVIADLLSVLKDQLTHTHGEYLEWIVIILIAAEIVVAAVNIIVDLYAGIDKG